MGEFCMPSLGADMEAAVLTDWYVKPGDRVKRGDVIAEVATDKGDIEIEVWEDGVVESILVQPGQKVPVATALARIGAAEPKAAEPAKAAEPDRAAKPPEPIKPPKPDRPQEPKTVPARERLRASPLARRMAKEHGLDLAQIEGTGPGGAIQKADILRVLGTPVSRSEPKKTAPEPSPKPPTAAPQGERMRAAIAAAMARSNREIPHYYLKTRIDMSRALSWLEQRNRDRSVEERVLPAALLARSVVLAAKKVPQLNAFWTEEGHQIQPSIHLGFAVSLKTGGVMVPAIREAQNKDLDELMAGLASLIERSRTGGLRSSEMEATLTVTNLGDRGVEEVYGVIFPPQVALVGFGRISDQPWAEDGMLGVRRVVTATLAADHRATDGRVGARFLELVDKALQKPEKLE